MTPHENKWHAPNCAVANGDTNCDCHSDKPPVDESAPYTKEMHEEGAVTRLVKLLENITDSLHGEDCGAVDADGPDEDAEDRSLDIGARPLASAIRRMRRACREGF